MADFDCDFRDCDCDADCCCCSDDCDCDLGGCCAGFFSSRNHICVVCFGADNNNNNNNNHGDNCLFLICCCCDDTSKRRNKETQYVHEPRTMVMNKEEKNKNKKEEVEFRHETCCPCHGNMSQKHTCPRCSNLNRLKCPICSSMSPTLIDPPSTQRFQKSDKDKYVDRLSNIRRFHASDIEEYEDDLTSRRLQTLDRETYAWYNRKY